MTTKSGTDLLKAKALLESDQIVAIPTETVYGLAANGFSEIAIAKVFEAKNRPSFDPLIMHVGSIDRARSITKEFPSDAQKLAEAFWPGPLTIILPKRDIIPDLATAGLNTMGVRMPSHPLTLELLQNLDFPLAAPSANPFGYISPTSAEHVMNQMDGKLPYILDGGPCTVGLESTIIDLSTHVPKILRKGGISVEDIEHLIGEVEVNEQSSSNPKAPGMLKSHYAPRIPLIIGDIKNLIEQNQGKNFQVLGYKETYNQPGFALSESGDLSEAARNLFKYLRELDTKKIDLIIAEYLPDKGLGRAINDRLKRAAAQG